MYESHPSLLLNTLFSERPFQGANPKEAVCLFVGLDANYDKAIETKQIFRGIQKYHEDGISFWQELGVHHPFLLPEYAGDGQRYHRNFARIGFGQQHANLISFIELLHVPTVGRSSLTPQDLDAKHLQYVNEAILNGNAKHIFISAGVAKLMRASGVFKWLGAAKQTAGQLRVFHTDGNRTVYLHLHFSNYGKFEKQMLLEARAIRELLSKDG
jgi:hypothetical protein